MHVAIDLTPLRDVTSGGLVQHMEGLLPRVFGLDPNTRYWVFRSDAGYGLPGVMPEHVNVVSVASRTLPAALDAMLAEREIAALFRVFPTTRDSSFPMARQVVVVPDLQHEVHPEFFSDRELFDRRLSFRRAIYKAGAIGLFSESSRNDLLRLFPDAAAPLFLMPPSSSHVEAMPAEPVTADERQACPDGPFFLYPANCWPHKNHRRLLQAFQRFVQRVPSFELILTGDPAGWAPIQAQFASLPVRHLGYVRPGFLAELYRRADALVLFSLYEGFGIPLLEAFHWGTPVLCSDCGSLPEVGGDAVLRCDPFDVAAMAELMERAVRSPELRSACIARGRDRLAHFDGDHSARRLIAALHSVADATDAGRERPACEPPHVADVFGASEDPYLFTVLHPLIDHRGHGLPVLQSWAHRQSLPRDRYEIILLGNGRDPAAEEAAQGCLSPQDRILRFDTDNDIELYDLGARQARGRWLFFTESHAFGEPDCLEAIARYLEWTGYAGACCHTLNVDENLLAHMEALAFEEIGHDLRMQPEHWSHLFLRGSALDRRLYLEEGGLHWQYGLFAEPVLSASWHRKGYRIGYARNARIRHVNTSTLAALRASVRNYTRGEWQFFTDDPPWPWRCYFSPPDRQRSGHRLQMARDRRRSLARSLALPRINVFRTGRRLVQLLRCLPDSLGPSWWLRQSQARYWWKVLRYRLSRSASKYAAYQDLNRAIVDTARMELLDSGDEGNTCAARPQGPDFVLADLPGEYLSDFHLPEIHQQTRFRWSGRAGCMLLLLDADKDVLELETLAGHAPGRRMDAFLNGAPLRRLTGRGERSWYLVPKSAWRNQPAQTITVLADCRRPTDAGVPDPRLLGVPLVRVRQYERRAWERDHR